MASTSVVDEYITIDKIELICNAIVEKKITNIVILSGAGVDTNSDIPDYRSVNGIFSTLGSNPEKLFTKGSTINSPLLNDFCHKINAAQPTDCHFIAKYLHDKGLLGGVITQNISSLYQKAGVPEEKIIEFHGSIKNNNVIMYEQSINSENVKNTLTMMNNADCVFVMGTSLQVAPFCAIPNILNRNGWESID